ncbi:SHOCT domain-containing protein [Natronorubrum bangense]|nr:SHOCT domain-containing protein [Natronorubrum bangense]
MTQLPKSVGKIGRNTLLGGVTLLVTATGSVAAQQGTNGYGGMMNDGWGWGMFGGWGFLWLLLLVGLIVLVVSAVNGSDQSQDGEQPDRALAELRERYARGEINEEEFEERRRTLRDTR